MGRGEGIPRLEYPERLVRWAEGRATPHGRATGCTWSGGGVEAAPMDDGHGRQVRALRWLGDVPMRYRSAIRVRPMDQEVRGTLGCIGLRYGVAGAPPSSTRSWLARMHRWGCGQRTRIEGRTPDASRPARWRRRCSVTSPRRPRSARASNGGWTCRVEDGLFAVSHGPERCRPRGAAKRRGERGI